MSSEHVEVLRDLRDLSRAAIKAGDWKVDGACDPDAVLRRADSAIAALSAPQPPAEAQRCTCPSGDGSLRWPCPAHPPSAPVGVEGLPEKWRREAPRARVDVGEDAALAWREAVYWCAFQLEAALAQQPAAVDGAVAGWSLRHERGMIRVIGPDGRSYAGVDPDLAAQQGGSDND